MGLIKQKEVDTSGYTAEYWKIIETNINYVDRVSHVTMGLYKDKQARQNGKNPVESASFDWLGDEFPFDIDILDEEGNNAVKIAYEKIKESKKETVVISPAIPAIPAVYDEEGNIVTEEVPEVPAVTEEREMNFFADAVDS